MMKSAIFPMYILLVPLPCSHVFGDLDEDPAPKAFSALSPVTLVAQGEVRVGHFDVARFTKTVGPFAKVC